MRKKFSFVWMCVLALSGGLLAAAPDGARGEETMCPCDDGWLICYTWGDRCEPDGCPPWLNCCSYLCICGGE